MNPASITCARIVEWDAGHRVFRHEGKCSQLHGHRYKAELVAAGPYLDDVGRVVDFGVLKERIGGWIDENWDHKMLLFKDDLLLAQLDKVLGVVSVPFNPTAEYIANYLLRVVGPEQLKGTGVGLTRVVVWETPNCFAEAKLA